MNIKVSNIVAGFIISMLILSVGTAGERIVVENVGFATPESVEYYAAEDVYLVTNINGSPFAVDDNGFISKISPDGKVLDLKWIDGARSDTRLHGPKGAAISGNILYVADHDEVHLFELPSGKQKTSVKISGSTFLNGITPGGGGSVYTTDMGATSDNGNFVSSGTDAVYQVFPDGQYKVVMKDKDMGWPNGIVVSGKHLIVVTFQSNEVYRVLKNGQRYILPAPPTGSLDGLIAMDDGSLIMSSWAGSAVYRLDKNGNYSTVADSLESPSDIGYDNKRNRILVPLFLKDKVVFLPL
ncbi:MAG: SMP-30/gluconolactonase/LRE family protein [Gammaproteobacteria bacterium]